MLPDQRFVSFAQNAEDVVLWRALKHLPRGCYVEVGANDPVDGSISRAFYDRGWSGIAIEPVPAFAEAYRRERERDVVVRAAIADSDGEQLTMHVIDGTGLSTLDAEVAQRHREAGWPTREETVPVRRLDDVLAEHLSPEDDIHFMVVDVEGSEASTLATVDLGRWRPWVLVVEATAPNSAEPTHEQWEDTVLAAGYELCLFDGLSRFYVAREHEELRPALGVPANPLDEFVRHREVELDRELAAARTGLTETEAERDDLTSELVRWRGAVLERWVTAAAGGGAVGDRPTHELVRLRKELADTHATLSWRITAPLRAVQTRRLRGWR
ncbi:FkbM family methyltransferase [Candidatus Blastococcus massiliensis]|uniref:FkbM family methyltransferase n=1 Tax=Candidatus Blastococcus massiliensis TaxID=1470358 RepID=UPI0004B4C78C|nr:FkbM family methyltransferase [Candidatus Blastococcus massiliensis]